MPMLWMNLLVFTKQPYSQDKFHDLKICPYDQEGFIAVLLIISVRTNHSSGRPRQVKTAQGRVKLTHQWSDRTSANFV